MRRRGYSAQAIADFCDQVGVTRRGNENFIQFHTLEHFIRQDLDLTAKRSLAVIEPVLVHITNVDDNFALEIDAPDFPTQKERGSHKIAIHKQVYVERSDVRAEAHKEFFGMAPGMLVGLKYAFPVKVKEIKQNDKGEITEVYTEAVLDWIETKQKPKTFINWISTKEAVNAEVRLYEPLFKCENPNALKEHEILDNVNPNSLTIYRNSKINKNLLGSPHLTTF